MIRSQKVSLVAGWRSARHGSAGRFRRRRPGAEPVGPAAVDGVPTVPTGYAELDKALGADQPYKGTKVGIQTQWIGGEGDNFNAVLAAFAAATGITIQQDRIGTSHETLLRTRIEGGDPGLDMAVLAQPSGVVDYGQKGKIVDVATIIDSAKLKAENSPATLRPGDRRRPHLGHPLQGRRQGRHLVSHQGVRGRGLQGPDHLGRADRPVRPDRQGRQGQPVVHRHRSRAPRPAGKPPTGSRKSSSEQPASTSTTSGSPAR